MSTFATTTDATTIMRAVLPRQLTPQTIADWDECTAMIYIPDSDLEPGVISSLPNLADITKPFTQGTAINQPQTVNDLSLGRLTMAFNADRLRCLVSSVAPDYTAPWSMVVVTQQKASPIANGNIFGSVSADSALQSGLRMAGTDRIIARNGDGSAQTFAVNELDEWVVLFASYTGTSIKIQSVSDPIATAAVSTPATGTVLNMGSTAAGFGYTGRTDMAIMLTEDIFAAENAAMMTDIRGMLRNTYGGVIEGI